MPEFLLPFSIYFEFEFMECWMNVCKPENSSYETCDFSSNISSNMQKKCWMKCWTGLLRPLENPSDVPLKKNRKQDPEKSLPI